MAACPDFTWSDTISGYVTGYDAASSTVELATSDQRTFRVDLDDLLVPGQYVIAYGIFYPVGDGLLFTAKHIYLMGRRPDDYNFEDAGWWTAQIDQLASFYRRAQFGAGPVDYANYRTSLQ